MAQALFEIFLREQNVIIEILSDPWLLSRCRGLLYGEGIFETIAIYKGKFLLLPHHCERFKKGAEQLKLLYDESQCIALLRQFSQKEKINTDNVCGVLKISLYAGDKIVVNNELAVAPRGYGQTNLRTSLLKIEFSKMLINPEIQNITTAALNIPMYPWMPSFVGLKLTSAIQYMAFANEALLQNVDQGIIFDHNGYLAESTMSNIVLLMNDGRLVTPGLQKCGVHGILRKALLEAEIIMLSDCLTEEDLLNSQRAYLINSVRGIQRIQSYITQSTNVQKIPQIKLWPSEFNEQAQVFETLVRQIMYVE